MVLGGSVEGLAGAAAVGCELCNLPFGHFIHNVVSIKLLDQGPRLLPGILKLTRSHAE
jgi:hypothetical protein